MNFQIFFYKKQIFPRNRGNLAFILSTATIGKKFDAQLELSKCKLIRIEAKSILTIETENRKMIGKLRIAEADRK